MSAFNTGRFVNVADAGYTGHLAVIPVADRADAMRHFDEFGIQTDIHPDSDHQQPIAGGPSQWQLPVTESAASRILSLPSFPELTDDEVHRVERALGSL